MMLFKILMVMVVSGVMATGTQIDHNGEHHGILCGLLGAAVKKWQTTNNPDAKKALSQAIFGDKNGHGDPRKFELPSPYNQPGSRENWCGKCQHNEEHYPGKSIPHDLLCLCTMGERVHLSRDDSGNSKALCGKNHDFNNHHHGWSNRQSGAQSLKYTWEAIVKPCFQEGSGETLERALANFSASMNGRETPNWSTSHSYNCGGASAQHNICVGYDGWCLHGDDYPQWWKNFAWALNAPDRTKTQLSAAGSPNATIGSAESAQAGQHRSSTQAKPSTTSASSTTEESPGKVLPLLSNQQSSTSLTHPLLCLLSASFFI